MKLLPGLLFALTSGNPVDSIHENQPPAQQGDITLSSDSSGFFAKRLLELLYLQRYN